MMKTLLNICAAVAVLFGAGMFLTAFAVLQGYQPPSLATAAVYSGVGLMLVFIGALTRIVKCAFDPDPDEEYDAWP